MAELNSSSNSEKSVLLDSKSGHQCLDMQSNKVSDLNDEIKYILGNTPESRLKLLAAPSNLINNLQTITKELSEASNKTENENESIKRSMSQRFTKKKIQYITVKPDSFACRGQGDEVDNSILPSSYSISIKESDNSGSSYALVSPSTGQTDLDNSAHLTYTTLLPRRKNVNSLGYGNFSYLTQSSREFDDSSPMFSTPLVTRRKSSRGTRRQRIPMIPSEVSYSPIPKYNLRGNRKRGRRARGARYQYNPQMFSTINSSSLNLPSTNSSLFFCGSSSGTLSNGSSSSFFPSANTSSILSKESLSLANDASMQLTGSSLETSSELSSFEYPKVPNNTPISPKDNVNGRKAFSVEWMPEIKAQVENLQNDDPREVHNEKERHRRFRIKNACNFMRSLLPNVTDKTDNATVFEQAADFIAFMRSSLGTEYDLEFVSKNCVF